MPNTSPHLVAGEAIPPSRFVMMDIASAGTPAGDHVCMVADSGAQVIGISMEGTNYPPLTDLAPATQLAASAGQSLKIYGQGDICLLYATVLTSIVPGCRLKPDAANTGGAIFASAGDESGAICLEVPDTIGELFRVQVALNPAAS